MNLGDAPRVFHDRLNQTVVVPIGCIVSADLADRTIEGIQHSRSPETVLVVDAGTKELPDEMQGVVDLMAVIDDNGSEEQVRRLFLSLVPPEQTLGIRPSRMQIRMHLRRMAEDYVAAQNGKKSSMSIVRDDVDPAQLEREILDNLANEKKHPIRELRDNARAGVASEVKPSKRAPPPPARPAKRGKVARKERA
jgi:hypothetical protein